MKNKKVDIDNNLYDYSIFEKVENTLEQKGKDYGTFYPEFVKELHVTAIYNKANRLANLTFRNQGDPNFEAIEDTILDLIGYCVLLDNARKAGR